MQRPPACSGLLMLFLIAAPAMAVELTPPSDLKPPADAVRSTAGILTRVLRAGTGPRRPVPGDTIDVHYTGWTAEGKLISSSVPTGAPARVVLSPTADRPTVAAAPRWAGAALGAPPTRATPRRRHPTP